MENQNNQLILWGEKSIKSVVWQKYLLNSVQMFYQVATGRPAQMFKKNNLGGILRIQVLYLCSAKIEESLDIHLVYHSGQWFLVNKQISIVIDVNQKVQQWASSTSAYCQASLKWSPWPNLD